MLDENDISDGRRKVRVRLASFMMRRNVSSQVEFE